MMETNFRFFCFFLNLRGFILWMKNLSWVIFFAWITKKYEFSDKNEKSLRQNSQICFCETICFALLMYWNISVFSSSDYKKVENLVFHWFSIKKLFRNFWTIHGETLVMESYFRKVADLQPATVLKRDSTTGVFLWILQKFSEQPFYRRPLDCYM